MKAKNTIKELKEQFNNITKFKIFEFSVIDNRTGEDTYILFHIELYKNSLIATHESLTDKQAKSKKISFVKVVLDKNFSIDSHLENLYDNCINAIINSEYYTLN